MLIILSNSYVLKTNTNSFTKLNVFCFLFLKIGIIISNRKDYKKEINLKVVNTILKKSICHGKFIIKLYEGLNYITDELYFSCALKMVTAPLGETCFK